MIFLGVDGGGTTTTLCIISSAGEILAQITAPSTYYFADGIELVARVLQSAVDEVCTRAAVRTADVDHAFFGLPGYGEASADVATLDAAPAAALGHRRYACGNDMVCGWAGSLGAEDGINVISGTGSMTYGEFGGKGVRVGGWGELFGDEGSGYWIAVAGLRAFCRMSDGRDPRGPLVDILAAHLRLPVEFDLIDVVLNRWHGDRSKVAALSRQVSEAADVGDEAAAEILESAGRELAQLVSVTRVRLGWPISQSVPVSYSGGVFADPTVHNAFHTALTAIGDGYDLRRPLLPPALGACLYAARLAGAPLGQGARARLGVTHEASAAALTERQPQTPGMPTEPRCQTPIEEPL